MKLQSLAGSSQEEVRAVVRTFSPVHNLSCPQSTARPQRRLQPYDQRVLECKSTHESNYIAGSYRRLSEHPVEKLRLQQANTPVLFELHHSRTKAVVVAAATQLMCFGDTMYRELSMQR